MFCTKSELIATKEKIAKINKRAEKKGFTGALVVEWEPAEFIRETPSGLKVKEEGFEVEITGTPPKYEGYTFLAVLEWDEFAGLVVRTAPGVTDAVNRENLRPGACDHCKINRQRNKIYLVSDEKENLIQVGSTCIKDFLGWSAMPVFFHEDEFSEDELSGGSGFGHTDPAYATEDVMAFAWSCIQQFGFHKSNDWENGMPTKEAVLTAMNPGKSKADRELAESIRPHVADAAEMGRKIREFILSDEFNGPSDYVINLKNIARGDYVTPRNFGFIVSAPQAWAKAQERTLIRKREQAEVLNEWNGNVGDKLTVTVKLTNIRYVASDFGGSDLYTFIGVDEPHVYKWFSSRPVFKATSDDPITIKGTVKTLEEYKGSKSTVLTRCKVI